MCLVKFSFTSLADCPVIFGLSRWYTGKEFTCNAEDTEGMSLVPGSGRSPGEGKGSPPQVFLPGNPMAGYSPWGPKRVGHDLMPKQQLVIFWVVQKYLFCQNSKLLVFMAQNHQFWNRSLNRCPVTSSWQNSLVMMVGSVSH